jgi:hypothetical protein
MNPVPAEKQLTLIGQPLRIMKDATRHVGQVARNSFWPSNSLDLQLSPIELIEHTFVHCIHQSADAGRLGGALFPNLYPHVGARRAEACVVVNLVCAFVQPLAGFGDHQFYLHRSFPNSDEIVAALSDK